MIRALPEFLQPFVAEAVLVLGCLALALIARSPRSRHLLSDFVLVVVAASAAAAVLSTTSAGTIAAMGGIETAGMVVTDPLAAHLKFLLSMVALVVVWFSGRGRRAGLDDGPADGPGEAAWAGFLVSLLGMQVMIASVHVAVLWTAAVVANLGLAQWVAGQRSDEVAVDVAADHAGDLLLEGALASAWTLLGFALLHGLTGTLFYQGMAEKLPLSLGAPGGASMVLACAAMVLAGLAFWSGLLPWSRSRIARAAALPLPVSVWLQVGTALAGLSVLLRWAHVALTEPGLAGAWLSVSGQRWPALLSVVGLATMTAASLAALREASLKRLIGWLFIVQAGYLLLGLVALSDDGLEALLFALVAVTVSGLGALTAVALVVEAAGDDDVEVLRGLARRRGTARLLALALVVFVLSLAAAAPLAGFEGRARILAALFESGGWGSAMVAALASALGLVCCARVVALVLDRPRDAEENVPVDFEAVAVLLAMLALTLGLGLDPAPLASFVERSVAFLAT